MSGGKVPVIWIRICLPTEPRWLSAETVSKKTFCVVALQHLNVNATFWLHSVPFIEFFALLLCFSLHARFNKFPAECAANAEAKFNDKQIVLRNEFGEICSLDQREPHNAMIRAAAKGNRENLRDHLYSWLSPVSSNQPARLKAMLISIKNADHETRMESGKNHLIVCGRDFLI